MNRFRRLFTALFVVAAAVVAIVGVAPAHAAAMTFGDPHNCEALAQGATISSTNLTPEPFDAAQIPYSSTFGFYNYNGAYDTIVGCQPHVPWQPNFNNANWDGYGNPFQCVELIARYSRLRYNDYYSWGDAWTIWNNHPSHYGQRPNGGNVAPAAGNLLVWNDTQPGHIAIITSVSKTGKYVTVLEQNFLYNTYYYTAKRNLYYYGYDPTSYYIGGSNYTAWRQDGSTFTGNQSDPVGWLG